MQDMWGFDPWVRKIPRIRKQQPTPVLLPRKFHGWKSLAGYSPWGRKESDTTEQLHSLTHSRIAGRFFTIWATRMKSKFLMTPPKTCIFLPFPLSTLSYIPAIYNSSRVSNVTLHVLIPLPGTFSTVPFLWDNSYSFRCQLKHLLLQEAFLTIP